MGRLEFGSQDLQTDEALGGLLGESAGKWSLARGSWQRGRFSAHDGCGDVLAAPHPAPCPPTSHVQPSRARRSMTASDASRGFDEACKASRWVLPCQNLLLSLPSLCPAACPMPGSFPGVLDTDIREELGPSHCAGDGREPSAAAFWQ